ncbi:SIR2 family protein [Erwinia sp. V71]|uniref:SIR2 family protein n=1 Tax=Erwinia sp. V71 TaxID=3369424 RepID=UPI003F63F036
MKPELKRAYDAGKLILFAGAGISRNLGLPEWHELISHLAHELGYDPDEFNSYGTHLALAEYYKKRTGSLGPLRSWMDREWHRPDIDVRSSEIHTLITQGNFSRIYTTNYDRWLELAHEAHHVPYRKVSSAAHLVSLTESERHIIKLHGDFDDDTSLVLDESSYFERLNFDSPLDLKLTHDVIGNSVLFVGYSISDFNIRLLFYRLTKMWGRTGLASARPKSYLFTNRYNPVAKEVLGQWGIEMIVSDEENPRRALATFLQELIA